MEVEVRGRWRGAGASRSQCRDGGGGLVVLPAASAPPADWIGTRDFSGVSGHTVNLVSYVLGPTALYFIWHCPMGAHQPHWVGHPRSGRESWLGSVIGPSPWRSILTFSPSISSHTLNLNSTSYYLFHYRSVHRACLVMTASTIRLTAIMHLSILKQTLLWALSIQKS